MLDTIPRGLRPPYLDAQTHRFRARIAADDKTAGESFAAAASRFRELGIVFWLAVTQLEHGEWLVARGREDEARPLLDEAGEIFEQLQATPWLKRLSIVASRSGVAAGVSA